MHPPGSRTARRALIVRAGALGDVLLLRRTVASLRAAGYAVDLLAPAAGGTALVGAGPSEVARLWDWERGALAPLSTGHLPAAGALRDELAGHEFIVAYTRSRDLQRGLERLGPPVVAHDPTPPPGEHAARWLARALPAGVRMVDTPAVCRASEGEALSARPFLRALPDGFVAIHPGSGSPAKNWPTARYRELLAALAPPRPWLVACGPADREAVDALRAEGEALVLEGVPARVLGAVLAQSGLYVGNDSGVSHLAAAWGAPTLSLFGPTPAAQWAPDGPRVRALQSPSGTMDGIDVEAVREAARALR
jgi:heptosyltransferase-3